MERLIILFGLRVKFDGSICGVQACNILVNQLLVGCISSRFSSDTFAQCQSNFGKLWSVLTRVGVSFAFASGMVLSDHDLTPGETEIYRLHCAWTDHDDYLTLQCDI